MLTLEEINDKLNEKYQPIMKERIVFAAEVIRDFESLTATGEFYDASKDEANKQWKWENWENWDRCIHIQEYAGEETTYNER